MTSGLGGFWCSRFLINSARKREFFTWFCTVVLSLLIVLSFSGYFFYGAIEHFVDVNVHPLFNRMLLLAFAPLALILGKVKRNTIIGGSVLCLGYAVCFLSDLRSAVLIPVVLGAIAVGFGSLKARRFLLILAPLAVVIFLFFNQLPIQKLQPNYEPAYYRIENYPFSWHIAVQNPYFGNGLRAPREKYLDDYQLVYRYSTMEKFADSTKRIVVSENIFLTFMADLGFPFLIIYVGSVSILLIKLIRWTSKPKQPEFVPALALLLPLVGALMHFLVLDGLLHPHVSWFFHILLGMIPRPQAG
ncbi:MAG: O-antigen ligase family protein [Desulfomonilaceae bacterium]